jgi:hypothetical protein
MPIQLGGAVRIAMLASVVLAAAIANAGAQGSTKLNVAKTRDRDTVDVPSKPTIGRIVGIFDSDSMQPIDSAEVIDLVAKTTYQTKSSGLIGLAGFHKLRGDTAVIQVRKLGYRDTAFAIATGAGDTIPMMVMLHRATDLPAVITEALANKTLSSHRAQFEELAQDASLAGIFIGPEEFSRNANRGLGDFLHAKGVGVLRDCGYAGVAVYLDGTLLQGTPPYATSDYEAAAYFSIAAAPVEYSGTFNKKTCGVLLLWTRQQVVR